MDFQNRSKYAAENGVEARRFFAWVLPCLLLLLPPARADGQEAFLAPPPNLPVKEDSAFSINAAFGYLTGGTTYGLKADVYVPDPGTWVTVSSSLEWPLDLLMAGAEAEYKKGGIRDREWGGRLRVFTNLTDPFSKMADSDFLSAYSQSLKFSYTESRITLRSILAEAEWYFELARSDRPGRLIILDLAAGYRHEFYSFDGFGADGWQLGSDMEKVPVSLESGTRVIHYEVHHFLPYFGIKTRYGFRGRFAMDADLRLLGVVSRDFDDHLLRHKSMHGEAYGLGASLGLRPRWAIEAGPLALSAGIDVGLQYIESTTGTLRQKYYADDPYIEGDQTQEKIPDTDFSIESFLFNALAVLGANF